MKQTLQTTKPQKPFFTKINTWLYYRYIDPISIYHCGTCCLFVGEKSLGVVCHRVPPVEKRLKKDCYGVPSVEQGFLGLLQLVRRGSIGSFSDPTFKQEF